MKQPHQSVFAVDLDGTLLHEEPEAVSVWGRGGFRYLSQTAAGLLAEISRTAPVVIATGRNAQSVQRLVSQIPDVRFAGFVLENGMAARTDLNPDSELTDEWAEVMGHLPGWERLRGFERCLGLIPPPDIPRPELVLQEILDCLGKKAFLEREQHKLFAYPSAPSKLSGIRSLDAEPLIAVGNECNDLDMLDASRFVASMDSAHEHVKTLIRKKRGYCSPLSSHAATEDILKWVQTVLNSDGTIFDSIGLAV